MKKLGAPIKWPDATSLLAKRLQAHLPFISCAEIGEKIGRSHETIRRYLAGKRDIPSSDLAKLAELANVDPGWLLTGRAPGESQPVSPSRDPEIQRELSEAFPRFLELVGQAQCIALDRCDHEARGWLALMQSFVASLQDYVGIDGREPGSKTTSEPSPAVKAG